MKKIQFCKNCVTPNSRPGITFDEKGFCNACQWAEKKRDIDWDKRLVDLKLMIKRKLESADTSREYDCVMTISGGKDSTFQAWFAKKILGLRVLGVRIEPLMPNESAENNFRNISKSVGIDIVSLVNNKKVFAKLSKECFIRYGNPYIPFYYNIFSQTSKLAMEKRIPLLIIGEDGDAENGGNTTKEFSTLGGENIHLRAGGGRKNYVISNNWDQFGVLKSDLSPYIEPNNNELSSYNIDRFFLSNYIPWKDNSNLFNALNVVTGFQTSSKRTVGTYTFGAGIDDKLDEIYLWIMWPKFGFHRATKSASNDIKEGKLNRNGAKELVKLYEGEFPWHVFDEFLDTFDLEEEEFWSIILAFVGDKENLTKLALAEGKDIENIVPAWEKIGENKWKHLCTVHGEDRYLELPVKRP